MRKHILLIALLVGIVSSLFVVTQDVDDPDFEVEEEKKSDVSASFVSGPQGVDHEKREINVTVMLTLPNSCHEFYVSDAYINQSEDAVNVIIDSEDSCESGTETSSVLEPSPETIMIETSRDLPETIHIEHFDRQTFDLGEVDEPFEFDEMME